MQTEDSRRGRQDQQDHQSGQKQDANQAARIAPSAPEQESAGRGTSTGNATGFVDPGHAADAADVEKNRDARRSGDPNDLGAAGDYSR